MIGGREPVLVRTAIVAAVAAILHVLIILGALDLDPTAEKAVVAAVDLVAGALIVLLVRPAVTPVDAPVLTMDQVIAGTVVTSEDDAFKLVPKASGNLLVDGSIKAPDTNGVGPGQNYLTQDAKDAADHAHGSLSVDGTLNAHEVGHTLPGDPVARRAQERAAAEQRFADGDLDTEGLNQVYIRHAEEPDLTPPPEGYQKRH